MMSSGTNQDSMNTRKFSVVRDAKAAMEVR